MLRLLFRRFVIEKYGIGRPTVRMRSSPWFSP